MTLPFNYNHYQLYQETKFKQKVKCEYCDKILNFSSLKRHQNNACKKINKIKKINKNIGSIICHIL